MEVVYLRQAINDIQFWRKSRNKKIQNRISQLIEDSKVNPYSGLGKPEPLKHSLAGKWSRRIDKEHRLIYEIDQQ